MIEKRCYQKLDEPVVVWLGLEFHEVVVSIGTGMLVALIAMFLAGLGLVGLVLGLAAGAGIMALFRSLKRGGPGYVFSRLYRWGLLDLLPNGLRPRHLLPIPGAGRRARFRMSPVLGEEKDHGASNAAKYYGR